MNRKLHFTTTLFLLLSSCILTAQSFNYFAGNNAGENNTTGSSNTFVGESAGLNNTEGFSNTFIGAFSGLANTTGDVNVFIGSFAGNKNTTGMSNSFVGDSAGGENTTGSDNSFFGYQAGFSNTTGRTNSIFGLLAGFSNTTGSSNCFFGVDAGTNNTTGFRNCIFGDSAGFSNNTGSDNCFYGILAGSQITSGSNNIAIGPGAGPSMANATQSNRLYIDVNNNTSSGNDDPLIYGEFDNAFVKINGTFEVTAGLSNPSDVNLKNNFESVESEEILKKVSQLNISKWTYKDRQNETHIGATAQEFYEAFGLGADNTHISTIDADGVALSAIKALKEKNDKLQTEVNELKYIVKELVDKLEN